MCLHGKIRVKKIAKENAILAWKEVRKNIIGEYVSPYYIDSNSIVYTRGLNTSKHPGFHVYLNKKEAYSKPHMSYFILIAVRIWGKVRFGEKWGCSCASATNMEIDSFKNLIR